MSEPERAHVVWHAAQVTRATREQRNGHAGCVVWFTGLSGCGKSTLANALEQLLFEAGRQTFLLDGDNVRHTLNASPALLAPIHGDEFARRFGLGFGEQDREENIRRISGVAQLFCAAGCITLTAFVSPFRRDRDLARQLVEASGRPGDFIEVFVDAPLEVCETRDPKGLYKKARAGELKNFTGIDSPYEPPLRPELHLHSATKRPDELAAEVCEFLRRRAIFSAP